MIKYDLFDTAAIGRINLQIGTINETQNEPIVLNRKSKPQSIPCD